MTFVLSGLRRSGKPLRRKDHTQKESAHALQALFPLRRRLLPVLGLLWKSSTLRHSLLLLLPSLQELGRGEWLVRSGRPLPAPLPRLPLPAHHSTLCDVVSRESLRRSAPVLDPSLFPDLRVEEQGRIVGPALSWPALVTGPVDLAFALLPAHGQAVESVVGGSRLGRCPPASGRGVTGRGLRIATGRVRSRSRSAPKTSPRAWTSLEVKHPEALSSSSSSLPSGAGERGVARSQRTPPARSASSVASPRSSQHALRCGESGESSEVRSRSRSFLVSRSSGRGTRKDRRACSQLASSRDRSRRSRFRSASRSRSSSRECRRRVSSRSLSSRERSRRDRSRSSDRYRSCSLSLSARPVAVLGPLPVSPGSLSA